MIERAATSQRASSEPGHALILVDTSAWVEYDRATDSTVAERLRRLVAETDSVAVTQPVIMEVVAGARDARRELDLRRLMQRFTLLRFDDGVDFDGATTIYRRCRQVGVTPRGLIDCMIAAVALRHGVDLLAADRDLMRVADVVGVRLDAG